MVQPIKKIKFGLFGGKFKPPHVGHFNIVKDNIEEQDKFYIWVSKTSKDNISYELATDIWKIYIKYLPKEQQKKIILNYDSTTHGTAINSPIGCIYDFIQQKHDYKLYNDNFFPYFTLYTGENEIERFKALLNPRGFNLFDHTNFNFKICPRITQATLIREAINNSNESFIKSQLPECLSNQDKKKILKMLFLAKI